MHCVSKYIIDYCVLYDVDTLVIGHNNGWKQNTKNMQNFTYIPYELFFKILKYKCEVFPILIIPLFISFKK